MIKGKKITIPLEFKLICMTMMLVASVVGFLLKNNLEIQSRDKLNSAYQSQVVEARIMSDRVRNKITNHVQNLKSLASNEANLENKEIYLDYFNSLMQNDADLKNLVVFKMNYDSKSITQEKVFGNDKLVNELKAMNQQYAYYWYSDRLFFGKVKGEEGLLITFYNPDATVPNSGYLYSVIVSMDKVLSSMYSSVLMNSQTFQVIYNENSPLDLSKIKEQIKNPKLPAGSFTWEKDTEYIGSFSKVGNLILVVYDPKIKVMGQVWHNMQNVIILGLLVLCFAIVGIMFFSRSLLSPINKLVLATKQIASGNFDVVIPNKSSDEIGVLASSFEDMSHKMKKLIEDRVESARMEQEINIAATVHKTFFPASEILQDKYKLYSFFKSASECGGDLWSYYQHNNKLIVMIGDATGHGLSSAFVTAGVKTCFSLIEKMIKEEKFDVTPANILSFSNKAVYDISKGQIQMTAFVMVLDLDDGSFTFANCGHNPPWIMRTKDKKIESLACPGYRLGEKAELEAPIEKQNILEKGDKILFYTDGLMENSNEQGEPFGKKNVKKVVESSFETSSKEMLQTLVMKHQAVCKKNEDDLTVVVFEFNDQEKTQEEAS